MSQSSPSADSRKMSSDSFTSPADFASTASDVASACSRDHVSGGCQDCAEDWILADMALSVSVVPACAGTTAKDRVAQPRRCDFFFATLVLVLCLVRTFALRTEEPPNTARQA